MLTQDNEREIIYTPTNPPVSNSATNIFLGLLVFALLAFSVYYIAINVPAPSKLPSSIIIERKANGSIVAPPVTAIPAPTINPAPVAHPVNAQSNKGSIYQ